MFNKLDVKLPNSLKNYVMEGKPTYVNHGFREYEIENYNDIVNILSEYIVFDIAPYDIELVKVTNYGTDPHTDMYSVALNIYLNAKDSETMFWDSELGRVRFRLTTKQCSRLQLTYLGGFVASPGDAYVLDTHYIHSVSKNDEIEDRVLLRCLWLNHTFEEILESIKIK